MRKEGVLITKWYSIGLNLLDKHGKKLDVIEGDNSRSSEDCCTEMFKTWLEYNPKASWKQLIAVLERIELNTAAKNIKSYICKLVTSTV